MTHGLRDYIPTLQALICATYIHMNSDIEFIIWVCIHVYSKFLKLQKNFF